ncbi:MAG: two-component sensor histidine kinase, partial [Rhodobacteraceae bacterium]|nr:two-component sensor histidine kinase [Paracoccaceae bacterium]
MTEASAEAEILDGLPLPALIVDAEQRITRANPAALALIGEVAVGRRLALAIRAPDLLAAVEEVLLHGDGPTREVPLRLNDESRFQAFVSALTAGGGRRALCVLRDVTAEMQGEAIRRDFVANVSHELRTPLTAMMGFIETLQGQAKDDAAARARFLGIMEREAGRMNRLVRDLLHLSRVEAEERMRPRDPVDLAGVLRSAAATVRPAAAERDSRIVLSGAEAPARVPGDPDQLLQVFLNLFENAVKYGARGQEVRVELRREEGARGQMMRVDVTDRGEGIDAIHLPRLTERFYR